MNILSYRGPSTAGGVSSALARIIETCADGDQRWWYMDGCTLETRESAGSAPISVNKLPQAVIDGHYSYCNSFIWPILHDLPEHATYNERDRVLYQIFNTRFARQILRSGALKSDLCFVNDYQLALATGLIARSQSMKILLFWHVPWPTSVSAEHAPHIAAIAEGLLGASRLGFHTEEYALNFLNFVEEHLPGYAVDAESMSIVNRRDPSRVTELTALPLGLDFRFWAQTAIESSPVHKDLDVREKIPCRFVLSVDRADYTKAVMERLNAIDTFFEQNPHRLGETTFVQVCQPTRTGLPAFDKYWEKCRKRAERINARWRTHMQEAGGHRGRDSNPRWQPISWLDKPVPPKVLAWLYSKADSMLINPVRDGLNLTAKEFAVCSSKGSLILSPGAGVWHEIGNNTVPLPSLDAEVMAGQIEAALKMPLSERTERLQKMKAIIRANTLKTWWRKFEAGTRSDQVVVSFPRRPAVPQQESGELLLLRGSAG